MIEWNVCENCGKILDKTQESCPFCGNDLTKVNIEFLKKELTYLLFLVKTIDSSNMEILKKDFPLIYEWKSKSYTLEGALINDLLNWFAYLGTANNDLSDNELEFINSLLNLNYSKEDIESLNSEITDLPVSFKFLHEQDVFKIRFDIYDVEFCEELFKIFKLTGKFFITVDDKLDDATLKRYEEYIKSLRSNIDAIRTTTTPNDDDLRLPEPVVDIPSDKKTINDYLEELNRLVGLENVKKDVNSLINLVQIRKIREERGIKQPAMSLHLVFSGNPGTGKTTVARILSKIYHELGILSKGHLVECDRSGLVGGYVGQTAIKTQEMISSAMGGILFIDEAYSLASKSENDYGREAIDTILKAMEDNREDFIVIVAGYPKLMDDFLHSNPGLESRFNKFIYFSDYNPEELYDIFIGMCEDSNLKLDSKAEEYLKGYFEDIYNTRSSNFANGRAVRNLFEHVLTAQANRLVSIEDISDDELNTLVFEDFKFDD